LFIIALFVPKNEPAAKRRQRSGGSEAAAAFL